MSHHLELAQGSRRSGAAGVPFGASFIDGHERLRETLVIESLGVEGCAELNRSQFIRLSRELEESFPDLRGTQVQLLKALCLVANRSEEFFLSTSKDQWLRTAITSIGDSHDLFSTEAIGEQRCLPLISRITIQSIVVPCHPFWPKLQAVRDEAAEVASKRLYFPSTFLDLALSKDRSLVEQLNEWEDREEQCSIAKQVHEGDADESKTSRPFWKVGPDDVVVENSNFGGGSQAQVWKISWRGGIFLRKDFKFKSTFDTELAVVRRVSHPHVVYSFGVSMSSDAKQHSLLMELLDRDLLLLIEDRVRLIGRSKPPFSRVDTVDILLQIAKAMTHMHELAEPVIHGDLKPKNILVSQCEILGDVCQYLVKVADFGSAKILESNPSSTVYAEGAWTLKYAAPELLERKLFPERHVEITYPKQTDVYSFGIVAFQVLTGLVPYEKFPSLRVSKEGVPGLVPYEGVSRSLDLKEGVIAGSLRPPLREACSRLNFWNDPDLIALVESCWHPEPSARPCFSNVTNQLESIYNNLNQNPIVGAHAVAPSQANAANGAPQNTTNGAHVFPPAQANGVDDGSQNQTTGTHAFSPPQANATPVDDGPQVSGREIVRGKRKEGSRKRGFVFPKLLHWTCASPGKVIE